MSKRAAYLGRSRCAPGDILAFGQYTFHASGENSTEEVRWSIDLRYSPDRIRYGVAVRTLPRLHRQKQTEPGLGRVMGYVAEVPSERQERDRRTGACLTISLARITLASIGSSGGLLALRV